MINKKEKFLIKNRKGDIPITILVVGIVGICTLAIYSFYFSIRGVGNDFMVLDVLEKASILKEKISFYEHVGLGLEEIKDILEIEGVIKIEEDEQGRIYLLIEHDRVWVRYNLP